MNHHSPTDDTNLAKNLYDSSPKSSSLRKKDGSVVLDSEFEAADASGHENCKLNSGFGPTVMCRESVCLENDLESKYVGSSSLKEGITQAVSSPFAAAHVRGIRGRGTVYQKKPGKWRAEIQISKVRHRVGYFATAIDAREALKRKRCELGLEVEDAEETLNRKKCVVTVKVEEAVHAKSCEEGLKVDAGQSEGNQRRRHVYLQKSGRFATEITHPMKKSKRIHLGTFDTAQEAEDVYNNMKRQFELMHPGYMNCEQPNERANLESLTEEAKEAYSNKMHEIDLMLCAYKKPRLSRCSYNADATAEVKCASTLVSNDPFVSVDGSSVIEAIKEEDAGGRMINVTAENGELDFGVIDSYGRLVDEYSRMDDELWVR